MDRPSFLDPDDLSRWDRAMRAADDQSDTGADDLTRLGILSPILTFDALYHFRGFWEDGGICRLRIFECDDRPPVVVLTELAANTNTSITNLIEHLAPEIVRAHLPDRIHDSPPAVFLEHYGEVVNARRRRSGPVVSLVSFTHYRPSIVSLNGVDRLSYGHPSWAHLDTIALAGLLGDGVDIDD